MFKDYFSMAPAPDQDQRWDVVRVNDSGTMTIAETGGQMVVNMGVAPNEELHLISKEHFTIPMTLEIPINMSQRIINQEVIIELVSVDPETMVPDEMNTAQWKFDGATAERGIYSVNNGGLPLVSSASTSVSTMSGSTFGVFAIQARTSEVNFAHQALDSNAGYSLFRRQQGIPSHTRLYKVRIRFRNLATAPASNTVVKFQYISLIEFEEKVTDFVAAGLSSLANSLPVNVMGGSIRAAGVTPADARSTSAVTSSSGDISAVPYLFNGTTYDRQRAGNTMETLLASAARTATTTTAWTNYQGKGIQVIVDVTALVAGASLVVKLQGKNIAGKAYDIKAAPTAITATGLYVYEFYPHGTDITAHDGLTAIMNVTVPRLCNVVVTAANTNSVTYQVDIATIN